MVLRGIYNRRPTPDPPAPRYDSLDGTDWLSLDAVFDRPTSRPFAEMSETTASTFSSAFLIDKLCCEDRRALKNGLRLHGLPPSARAAIWPILLPGVVERVSQGGTPYRQLVLRPVSMSVITTIDRDLARTGPSLPPATAARLRHAARRVLVAHAIDDPRIGYVQGMNAVATALLSAGFSEEGTFLMLKSLTHHVLPERYYADGLFGLRVDLRVLASIAEVVLPNVMQHLSSLCVPFELVCTEWLCTLFVTSLPAEVTFRIWDVMFFDGSKVLFRAALALIAGAAPGILAATHAGEVQMACQTYVDSLVSPTVAASFFASMFSKRLSSFPQSLIEERRAEQRFLLSVEATQRATRDAARLKGVGTKITPVSESMVTLATHRPEWLGPCEAWEGAGTSCYDVGELLSSYSESNLPETVPATAPSLPPLSPMPPPADLPLPQILENAVSPNACTEAGADSEFTDCHMAHIVARLADVVAVDRPLTTTGTGADSDARSEIVYGTENDDLEPVRCVYVDDDLDLESGIHVVKNN